jgi:hypothetical protein
MYLSEAAVTPVQAEQAGSISEIWDLLEEPAMTSTFGKL